ncbi:MAG: carbamoyl-phosphate synthase large subunit [Myxococcales bacterium]|nr:carbamoyl-phosphate synthase large subunit [Myxococcales bacterium]
MPKRTDIKKILLIGAGPIIIGQAAEFDYSGTQAAKALKREGYEVVLVNSNPATIMTDPELVDATYVEPITTEILEMIIEKERPDALLPTVGGQTGLNASMKLAEAGILDKYDVKLLGASVEAVRLAEDRKLFQEKMIEVGLEVPRGRMAHTVEEAVEIAEEIGSFPLLLRASFTLGGSGSGVVYNKEDFLEKVAFGLRESPVNSVLIEESILGWKEYELEVMRDRANNFVVICTIENIDPMGIHTGDSVTVAPSMTLTDREYQMMRDQARVVMHAIGVETGGSNVQFAVHPETGRVIVIEMNPRVSRSSALASKATGFPIAKIAALLAVGYTLDEIKNDITQTTVASFEPSIDYVVTKLPRWAFEKFPGVDPRLGTQMKSVGEAMSIGRTFKESFLKGLQSLELSRPAYPTPESSVWDGKLESLVHGRAERMWALWEAFRAGHSVDELHEITRIDPWFLVQIQQIVSLEEEIVAYQEADAVPEMLLHQAKQYGFGDEHIAWLLKQQQWPPVSLDMEERLLRIAEKKHLPKQADTLEVRKARKKAGIQPTFQMVDTCAAEFTAYTPYLYSSYEAESEAPPTDREKVIILGGGPNRIGQGIEFDYCCVHAVQAVRNMGYEAVMINCNPETVSTDYDTSDRLYFEPLTVEHVLNIVEREQPLKGVIAQFGGQTPLNLVHDLQANGVPILGSSPETIDRAEDRGRFGDLLRELEIPSPAFGIAKSLPEARKIAQSIGYPVLVRPSYVLGGRAMVIVYDDSTLDGYVNDALSASPSQTLLIDQYLEDSYEVDVDAVCDGNDVVVCGVMQHIEEAGIHSGDSACVLPPFKISAYHLSYIQEYTEQLGRALGVCGLMNIQYAIKDDRVYVLEVNPRASRTVPFVSKAKGVPFARIATYNMLGRSLEGMNLTAEPSMRGFFVKEAVLPFKKFEGVDARLGPEMRSTGEVMGFADSFGHAFAKAQTAAGDTLPLEGNVFISVNDFDKAAAMKIARDLHRMGFHIIATRGTAEYFERNNLPVQRINKVRQGSPHIVELLKEGKVNLILNTPLGQVAYEEGAQIRVTAVRYGVPLLTTLSAGQAAVQGIQALRAKRLHVRSLQEHYQHLPSLQQYNFGE